jgi:hypothetical protein
MRPMRRRKRAMRAEPRTERRRGLGCKEIARHEVEPVSRVVDG